jgi:hypothetical protein
MTVLYVILIDINGMLANGLNTCDKDVVLPSLNCPNLHTISFGGDDAKRFLSILVWMVSLA